MSSWSVPDKSPMNDTFRPPESTCWVCGARGTGEALDRQYLPRVSGPPSTPRVICPSLSQGLRLVISVIRLRAIVV